MEWPAKGQLRLRATQPDPAHKAGGGTAEAECLHLRRWPEVGTHRAAQAAAPCDKSLGRFAVLIPVTLTASQNHVGSAAVPILRHGGHVIPFAAAVEQCPAVAAAVALRRAHTLAIEVRAFSPRRLLLLVILVDPGDDLRWVLVIMPAGVSRHTGFTGAAPRPRRKLVVVFGRQRFLFAALATNANSH